MSGDLIRLRSISEIHKMLGIEPPKHPLITVINVSGVDVPEEIKGVRITSDFYMIAMKDADCGMQYGRNYYDFNEGVLTFVAPNQVVSSTSDSNANGWMLFFHPDLIRQSGLGQKIDTYHFFSYDVHEALHLSAKEEDILEDCIRNIKFELDQNIDGHSQPLLVSNLELLLNYCNRFYERQFHTRAPHHKDLISTIEGNIKQYYLSKEGVEEGGLTVQALADSVHLSANYLSDLLKKETGMNAKEMINEFVIDRAKTQLLSSEDSVSEIAYDLGFNYPHYFSRLFKKKTGMTPQKYRASQMN